MIVFIFPAPKRAQTEESLTSKEWELTASELSVSETDMSAETVLRPLSSVLAQPEKSDMGLSDRGETDSGLTKSGLAVSEGFAPRLGKVTKHKSFSPSTLASG